MSAAAPGKNDARVPLPPIPAKRYFTIGEVSELCGVKPHVLRYWEQEFTQLRPMKRRGNRRYYQHHEVLLVRRIRELLYEQGFTISGARNRLGEAAPGGRRRDAPAAEPPAPETSASPEVIDTADTAPLVALREDLLAALELLLPDGQPDR
ncbi:MAG: HTH-type transcriptional repressor YcgE [Pseudomonadota bacterium]|jgi:DNA-binding transcriptional MerR regulator